MNTENNTPFTIPDNRNIADKYKWWDSVDITKDLNETRSEMVSVFVNLSKDMNLGTGVRNSNWFNTQPVRIAGKRGWDRRGAVGTHVYSGITHNTTPEEAIAELRAEGYRIVAAEIDERAVPLPTYSWEVKSAVVYGEEGDGLTDEIMNLVDDVVFIPGRGSVRSLNVATTSGIFMYDYSMKLGLL